MKKQTCSFKKTQMLYLKTALIRTPFEGWTESMLGKVDQELGFEQNSWKTYFPEGALEVIDFWFNQLNEVLLKKIEKKEFENWRIRDKVHWSVQTGIKQIGEHKEAFRRARIRILFPDAGGMVRVCQSNWKIADTIWRGLKDLSTDLNYTSKRLILSIVYHTTVQVWLTTHDEEQAWAFLDRRIDNVMQFEKFKAGYKKKKTEIKPDFGAYTPPSKNKLHKLARLRYQPVRTLLNKRFI